MRQWSNSIDPASIPDDVLTSEWARRQAAKRRTFGRVADAPRLCGHAPVVASNLVPLIFVVIAVKPHPIRYRIASRQPHSNPNSQKKKTKQPPTPTQPDIVRGCIAVRNITFERARLILLNSNLGVSGWIENKCGRDAYVSAEVKFFGANGDLVDEELLEKLVGPAGLEFRVGPSRTALEAKPDAVYSTIGRVTEVWVRFQP